MLINTKQKQKLKSYTFENSSLSEYNWVKVVLVLKRIESNYYYKLKIICASFKNNWFCLILWFKNNKTELKNFLE